MAIICILCQNKLAIEKSMSRQTRHQKTDSSKKGKQRKLEDQYKLFEIVGKGAFGKVHKAISLQNNQTVAVKVIDTSLIKSDLQYHVRAFDIETQLMFTLKHKNIIKLIDSFKQGSLMILVMEYCDENLLSYMKKKEYSSESQVLEGFQQIVEGLNYLHSNGIMHRDLKCQNILFHKKTYKLCDLGFSKRVDPEAEQQNLKMTVLGTPINMAPQVKKQEKYGFSADVWSLGTVFFCMFYNKYPQDFGYSIKSQNICKIKDFLKKNQSIYGFGLSHQSIRLIELMLNEDKRRRISCEELLIYLNSIKSVLPNIQIRQKIPKKKIQEFITFMKSHLHFESKFQIDCELLVKWTDRMTSTQLIELLEILFKLLKIDQIYKYTIEFVNKKLKFVQKRQKVQYTFLLLLRCSNDIDQINTNIKKISVLEGNSLQEKVFEFVSSIRPIIRGQLDVTMDLLTALQSEWNNILKDRLKKMFHRDTFDEKEKYFLGYQDKDYTRKEQTDYIRSYYEESIVPILKDQKKDYSMSPINLLDELSKFTTLEETELSQFRQVLDRFFKKL